MKIQDIPISKVTTNGNVRTVTAKAEDKELAASIKTHGIIEPLVAREVKGKVVLIAGHRRLAAAKLAGLKSVPVVFRDAKDEEVTELQIVENLLRRDLTPLEEAEAYKNLIDCQGEVPVWDHVGEKKVYSKEFLARVKALSLTVNKSKKYVLRTLRLVELPKAIIGWLRSGKLTAAHAMLLIDLPPAGVNKVVKDYLSHTINYLQEGDVFQVSDLKRFIERTFTRNLKEAPFVTDKDYAGEPACTACPYNSGNAMALFDVGTLGKCRQPKCYNRKREQIYRDVRAKVEPNFKKLKIKFVGYGRMVPQWNSPAKRPDLVKGFPIINIKGKAIKDKADKLGWAIIKPAVDTPNPKCDIVYVARDLSICPPKIKAAVEKKNASESGRYDWEEQQFINRAVENALNQATEEELKKYKPSDKNTRAFLLSQYKADCPATAKIIGMKLGKSSKKAHATDILSMNELAFLLFANDIRTGYEGWRSVGVDGEKIQAEVSKKAKAEYAEQKKAKKKEEKNDDE